jgi:pimeloyl-ACP methyl ester carboxylesterase
VSSNERALVRAVGGTSTADSLPEMPYVTLDGHSLEYALIAGTATGGPLVFLHEGLGSIRLWRRFPDRVCQRTGRAGIVYARYGYGGSDVGTDPRRPDYMHHEAVVVLPALLAALQVERPVLIGHSDGASIALLAAGSGAVDAERLVLLAPHVFVEDVTIASIEAARVAYETTDLPDRLARHHRDGDATFRGWNDVWLSPEFRSWNIERTLPGVTCPVLCVQGLDDQYGTLAQLDAIEAGVTGPCERVVLAACGHSPHVDRAEATLAAVSRACRRAP